MEVLLSDVQKITLLNTEFGQIEVMLEELGETKGKIIISHGGEVWSSYWGAMGCGIKEFFTSCDEYYLAGKLSSIEQSLPDLEKTKNDGIIDLFKSRKSRQISKGEARLKYNDFKDLTSLHDHAALNSLFGDEWWYEIKHIDNPEYLRLLNIVKTAQEGLRAIKS